ncbi:MAG: ABC transporter substrate-binding protein [Oscillospiraceae bacterium]|nr:ABC transporter substrate-binding protein [Oscillospiraceae bacterium]
MTSKLTKILALLLVCVMVLGMFAGCGKKDEAPADDTTATDTPDDTTNTPDDTTGEDEGPVNDTLVVAYDYFSEKFSPFFATTSYDQDAAGLTQVSLLPTDREGNVLLNAKEGEVVTYNGTDYTYTGIANCEIVENADGTVTYKIDMRNDVVFSDGDALTADDVIFSIYVLCDPTYDGSSTLYSQKILGMDAYRSGMDTLFNVIFATERAGYEANDLYTEEQYNEFWAAFDAAGVLFVEEIVAYCEGYGATDVASAAELWGYSGLFTAESTAADWFNVIVDNFGYDLSSEGINYESAGTDLATFMYQVLGDNAGVYQAGVSTGEGAANIAGVVKTGDYSLEITVEGIDPTFIYQLTLAIAPLHYYGDVSLYNYEANQFGFVKGDLSGVRGKTTQPLGAGPYVFVSYENNVISYVANESYYDGAPKIANLKLQGVSSADKMTGMTTDLFDITIPNYNDDDIAAIKAANSNGELTGDKITTMATDFLGYGYIGINADNVKVGDDKASDASKALRRGIATLLAVYREPVVYAYYGDRASIIQYPISNTSWAAPKPADEGYALAYSQNAAGEIVITADMTQEEKVAAAKEAAKSLFIAAGYTFDEATGKFTAAPEGADMAWEIIIPANGVGDHPAYGILTETKNALNEMGLDLIINDPADSNELWDALDANTAQMWAAAWGSTVDPDMYQVYHSSNVVGMEGSSNSNHYRIQDEELDNLIMTGRSTTDQAFRKATYKSALELIMEWGVEIPTYQRQEATLFSTERVNVETIPADMTPYYGWASEIHLLELN